MNENQSHPDFDERPLPDEQLVADVKVVIKAAAESVGLDLGAFWQCFTGDDQAFSRWKNSGKLHFTERLIAMFQGSKSRAGYRVDGASADWEDLVPALKRGDFLVPRLDDYRDRLTRYETAASQQQSLAQANATRDREARSLLAGSRPNLPIINRAKIKNEERLFSVLPLFGQPDERSADLILDMSFGAPNREIIDPDGEPSASDMINVAINRCAIHVDWPTGEIRGQDLIWSNTGEVDHRLEMLGVRKARVWQMESSVSGAPIRGVFEGQYLCRLEGPDRSDVSVRLSLSVSDLKITSKLDGELIGNDRLRVFQRYLAQTVESEFDQDSTLTVFEGPVQKLDS